ncbi:alpha/beta hydrolase [Nocardia colli]|uniref:Alpha/beta hydrolase n=1 Tax=Nocardia colli TaxID=2545717 RepID=A0A5N0EKT9_9NOCA|nr:alpha/beta hydrolase [Nocardia colli]KAA8889460.1 alpha/beta hydrolase [Nocardia colli]
MTATVVIVGGLGSLPGLWTPVTELLDPAVTVVHYRRPTVAIDLHREVAELARLIGRRSARETVVLVAHSMGAFGAEALARCCPGSVDRLVLIDPSIAVSRRKPLGPLHSARASMVDRVAGLLSRNHRGSRLFRVLQPLLLRRLSAGQVAEIAESLNDSDYLARSVTEWNSYSTLAADLIGLRRRHPRLCAPTMIVTAARHRGARWWVNGHRKLAIELAADHRIIDRAGHLLMVERPEVVAELITEQYR